MSLRVAVTFLTRFPLGARAESPLSIARSLPWFPLVGAAIGLLTAAVYAGASRVWTPLVAAVLAVSVATWLTGALHEDGLADTADAFGGSFDRARALEIFKDPRLGSYGVLALVLSSALRIALLASFVVTDAWFVLPAAHALSRGLALQLLHVLDPAAPGLGASYASGASRRIVGAAALVALLIATLCTGLLALPLATAALPGLVSVGWLAKRKIDGLTGDVLGAAQQVAELSILAVALAAAREGVVWAWLI